MSGGAGSVTLRGMASGPTGASNAFVVDVGDADFEHVVLDRSVEVPVIVDFWAPWCAPCRTLGPVLERLAAEHAGAFLLAKVNVDEAQQVAGALQVRSIPAVKAFRDGRVVSEFVGAQPESAVRRFLDGVLPTEADRLVAEAADLASRGHENAAEERLRTALALEGRNEGALVSLAQLLAERGETAEAGQLLERVLPGGPFAQHAERLAASLRTRAASPAPADTDLDALRARVAAAPDDLAARLDFGHALSAAGRYDDALAELLTIVKRDPKFADEDARKAMLDIFSVLGADDPRVHDYRAQLARALFR